MSYARQSETSDLYIYVADDESNPPVFCCSSCLLIKPCRDNYIAGVDAIIKHIGEHITQGHLVEADVIQLIKEDFPNRGE